MEPTNDLGPQISIYRAATRRPAALLSLYVLGGLLVLAPLAYGFYRASYAYTHFGPTAADQWSRPWFMLSLGALLLLILIALRWLQKYHRSVALHQEGLWLALPQLRPLRWGQIAGIATETVQERFLGRTLRIRFRATLFPVVGKPLPLVGLRDLPELTTRIKGFLYPHLHPALLDKFQAGQWLHFGPVAIQSSALRIGERQVPWPAVREINVQAGDLVVEFVGQPTLRLPVSAIPNLELLFQIMEETEVGAQ